jgi:hypothetical protein
MKTSKTALLNFLNLLMVRGEIENKDMIIQGTSKQMESLLVSPLKEFCIKGTLDVEDNFSEAIGIGNINLLKSMLNNFDEEEIAIHKNENKLIMTSKNKRLTQQFCLKDCQFIKNSLNLKDFEKVLSLGEGNEIILYKPEIEKLLKLNKSMNSSVFYLKGNKENIDFFFDTNENNILYSFVKKHNQDFYVKISKKLLDLFEVINLSLKEPKDGITCSMKTDSPIVIKIKNKNYEITYILAQLMKKEGDKK